MYDRAEFSSILEKLAKVPGFYQQIKEAQLRDSKKWGQLDGNAGRNLLKEINLLLV